MNVCLNQLKDIQLAIAVTRVYEGDNGPVLKELLEEKVLPLAAQESNRWLASWAFWMLHRRDMAVRALIASAPYHLSLIRRLTNPVTYLHAVGNPAVTGYASQAIFD